MEFAFEFGIVQKSKLGFCSLPAILSTFAVVLFPQSPEATVEQQKSVKHWQRIEDSMIIKFAFLPQTWWKHEKREFV